MGAPPHCLCNGPPWPCSWYLSMLLSELCNFYFLGCTISLPIPICVTSPGGNPQGSITRSQRADLHAKSIIIRILSLYPPYNIGQGKQNKQIQYTIPTFKGNMHKNIHYRHNVEQHDVRAIHQPNQSTRSHIIVKENTSQTFTVSFAQCC